MAVRPVTRALTRYFKTLVEEAISEAPKSGLTREEIGMYVYRKVTGDLKRVVSTLLRTGQKAGFFTHKQRKRCMIMGDDQLQMIMIDSSCKRKNKCVAKGRQAKNVLPKASYVICSMCKKKQMSRIARGHRKWNRPLAFDKERQMSFDGVD